MVNVDKPINGKNSRADKPERRPRNAKLNSSKSSALSFAAKRKLNCSREEAIEELRRWFSDDEAEEYVNSFEEQTGAKITRIATPEEAEQYDGDFWATKDGKESLWCRGNGFWYEEENLDGSRSACGDSTADEKLNSSSATGLDGLIDAVKSSAAESYSDKFEIMQLNPAYEEELMADAYYKAEQMLSEQLDVPNVMLETSVQQGYGSVDAWAEGGTGEHLASYDFEDESNAVWDIIKNWSGDADGLVDAVAEKIVDLVLMSTDFDSSARGTDTAGRKLNSSRNRRRRAAMRKKLNSSRTLNCTEDSSKQTQQFEVYYEDEDGNEIEDPAVITVAENLEGIDLYEAIQDQFADKYPKCSWITIRKTDTGVRMNSAKDDVKITTESGNEVAIGDIQIVQNPTTNELALFIKESEDDEIPEGFVVIGKATSAQTELSDADVGEDVGEDLDSSKKKN